MRRSIILLSIIIFSGSTILQGQSKGVNRDKYRINISQTTEKINIDGLLDEEVWKTAECTGKFQRVTPTDTGYAIAQTKVRLTYDELNLYLGIICHDPTPGKRPVESLRRDYNFTRNDNFMLFPEFDSCRPFSNLQKS